MELLTDADQRCTHTYTQAALKKELRLGQPGRCCGDRERNQKGRPVEMQPYTTETLTYGDNERDPIPAYGCYIRLHVTTM